MTVRNKLQLAHDWRGRSDQVKAFVDLFPYVRMLQGCYLEADYVPPPDLVNSFALSANGELVLADLISCGPELDQYSREMAVIAYFSHDELFVDLQRTDIAAVHKALATEIETGRIRFPQEYGRLLYDRFFDLFPTRTNELSFEETRLLLDDVPNASYQFGSLVVGPFGPAKSAAFRDFSPSHSAPLWHCSDIGCSALPHSPLRTSALWCQSGSLMDWSPIQ